MDAMAGEEDNEGWVDAGSHQTAPAHFDLTLEDHVGSDPALHTSPGTAPVDDPFSTNLLQDFLVPEQGANHQGSGISPFAAACQQLDLEMELDGDGWGVVDEEPEESEVEELGLEDDLPQEWLGSDGFIESNWVMDQSAFDATLDIMGLKDERLALQDGEEASLLEQLVKHHHLSLSSRQRAFHLQQIRISIRAAVSALPLQ